MQLALRPYVTVGVAILGAGLIQVTPVDAPHISQRTVDLAAAEMLGDLVGTLDAPSLAAADATDFWAQLTAWWEQLPGILVGLTFWAEIFLAPIIMPVINFFYAVNDYLQEAWDWLAGALGLAPPAVEAVATDMPAAAAMALIDGVGGVDVSSLFAGVDGLVDPAAVADLGAQLVASLMP